MCNGYRHKPGCACGFGPPYPWHISPKAPVGWDVLSILSTENFSRVLRNLGFSGDAAEQEVGRYKTHGFPVSGKVWDSLPVEEKEHLKDRFLSFFKIYRYEEVQQSEVKIDIPIFLLHSPQVANSKVTYKTSEKTTGTGSWTVMVLGFGTGSSQEFQLVNTSEFSSEAGECKLVRLPVLLQLTELNLFLGDKFLRKILRVEPSGKHPQEIMREGVKGRGKAACWPEHCSLSKISQVYPLAKDSPASISTYTEEFTSGVERDFSVGVEAFHLKGVCKAKVKREAAITLTIRLPGGHDYRMFRLKEPDGLVWERIRKKKPPSSQG